METNQIVIIINTIVVAIYAIILFKQNTTIKNQNITINSIKSFMEIFDVNKVKEYSDLRVEGETYKFQMELTELKRKQYIIEKEKNDIIQNIEKTFKSVISKKEKAISVKEFLILSFGVLYNVSGMIYAIQLGCFQNFTSKIHAALNETEKLFIINISNMNNEYSEQLYEIDERLLSYRDKLDSDPEKTFELIKSEAEKIDSINNELDEMFEQLFEFESKREKI